MTAVQRLVVVTVAGVPRVVDLLTRYTPPTSGGYGYGLEPYGTSPYGSPPVGYGRTPYGTGTYGG